MTLSFLTAELKNVLYYGKGYGRDSETFMPVRFSQGNGVQYSGAEIGIASALANSGEKHAIIKYANGDTQLSTLRNCQNICNFVRSQNYLRLQGQNAFLQVWSASFRVGCGFGCWRNHECYSLFLV